MEIRNQVTILTPANADINSAESSKTIKGTAKDAISITALLTLLPLEMADATESRRALESSISLMAPDKRKEIIVNLRELVDESVDTPVGKLLEKKLPEVEKEVIENAGIDRLLELLFSLLMTLGQSNTARNAAAAKFAEISVQQAAAAGAKGVNAAIANLGGAVTGMAVGTAVAGVGFQKFSKATNGQIRNISTNGRQVNQLRAQNAATSNALNRSSPPSAGSSPQKSLQTLDSKGKQLELKANAPSISSEEQAVLNQTILRTDAKIAAKELASQSNSQKFSQQQFGGQTVISFSQPLSAIAQASGGVISAEQQAASKLSDAHGAVASTIQHSEEQAAQRATELLTRMFSMIASSSDQSRATLDSIVQNIKA
ncbi:IpaC/SipC family type III secretion system effector [Glaciimonas sp. Gout2]|uniref:IpaC/SipC family type III secretion system effector n=1 Tax=unclassified Glaciimonas TaxID=2644401 RepID=UPI002B23721B|nr:MULTISPECIES: IpaC/SipC family type III secretion system effector [unclassified Glaciimonas]MEB0010300.1 IpaC/SipC family type III secretion system effector [Glaciimonas sp. Cout2]MEB0084861.1 IpaC/SipC family type III secretion system effector [Glaciimonas sp. Gout2]